MKAFKCNCCKSIFFDAEYIGVLYVGKGKITIDNGVIITSSFDVIERVEHTQDIVCPHCSNQINIDRINMVDVDDLDFEEIQLEVIAAVDWAGSVISLSTMPEKAKKLNELIKGLVVTL